MFVCLSCGNFFCPVQFPVCGGKPWIFEGRNLVWRKHNGNFPVSSPWSRCKLYLPHLPHGVWLLVWKLRATEAPCMARRFLPHHRERHDGPGRFLGRWVVLGHPLSPALSGFSSSCVSCVTSAQPPNFRRAPGVRESCIRVLVTFARRDAPHTVWNQHGDLCASIHALIPARRTGACKPLVRGCPKQEAAHGLGPGMFLQGSAPFLDLEFSFVSDCLPHWDVRSRCPLLRGAFSHYPEPVAGADAQPGAAPSPTVRHLRPAEGPGSCQGPAGSPPRRAGCPLPPASQRGSRRRSNPCTFEHAGSQTRRGQRVFLPPHKMQEFRGLTRQRDNMKCRLRAPVALGNERLAIASQKAYS